MPEDKSDKRDHNHDGHEDNGKGPTDKGDHNDDGHEDNGHGHPPTTVPGHDHPPTTVPVTIPPVTVPPVTRPPVTIPSDPEDEWAATPPVLIAQRGLWLVDADKQAARLVIGDLAPVTVGFSSDGSRAAVAAFDDPPYDGAKPIRLYVVDVATGQRHQIAPNATAPSSVSWSADGTWIAFASQPRDLWVVHPDGSDLHRVATTDGYGGGVMWAGNTHVLATPLANDNQVLIVDVDKGTERRWAFPHPYLVDWSPLADRLAVSTVENSTELMNPLTGALVSVDHDARFPRWHPTLELIAVRKNGMAGVMPSAGGPFRPFGQGSPVDWSSDGRSLDYQDLTHSFQVTNLASGRSRTVAVVSGNDGLSLSPTVWLPHSRQVAVLVEPNAAVYLP